MKKEEADGFAGYKPQLIQDQPRQDLIFIPAFTTDDIQKTISENREYIPWLKQQFLAGARLPVIVPAPFYWVLPVCWMGKPPLPISMPAGFCLRLSRRQAGA